VAPRGACQHPGAPRESKILSGTNRKQVGIILPSHKCDEVEDLAPVTSIAGALFNLAGMSREFLQAGVFYVGLIASAAMMLFVLGAFGQL
jgi:hypothetical protein